MLFAVLCRQSNPTNREIFLAIARRVELMYTVRVSAAQRVDWLNDPRIGHAGVDQRDCLTPSRLGTSMSLARDRACGISPDERIHARSQLRQ
jgi:hypothetical protein